MKRALLFIISFVYAQCAVAQNIVTNAISVNGLKIGSKYSKIQMSLALGGSLQIVGPSTEIYSEEYELHAGEDVFYLINNEFYGFNLKTPKYAVNNCIRIGENISCVQRLGGLLEHDENHVWSNGERYPGIMTWRPSRMGVYAFVAVDIYYDSEMKITRIDAFINDL